MKHDMRCPAPWYACVCNVIVDIRADEREKAISRISDIYFHEPECSAVTTGRFDKCDCMHGEIVRLIRKEES